MRSKSAHPSDIINDKLVKGLKKKAKELKKRAGISQSQALDEIARDHNFPNWKAITKVLNKNRTLSHITPNPQLDFIHDEDLKLSKEDVLVLKMERQEDLDDDKKILLEQNRSILARKGIDYSLFEPTKTGLSKSIIDATHQVRFHFRLLGFHDYETQQQQTKQQTYKVVKGARLISREGTIDSQISMYRPATKNGDPRMWFKNLGKFTNAGSQIAIIIFNDIAHLIDLTKENLYEILKNDHDNVISNLINEYSTLHQSSANELLNKLRSIAVQPLIAAGRGDSDVGNAVEKALGIAANSSKKKTH